MVRGEAQFTSEELSRVLGHYSIGKIKLAKVLRAGNRRAPKLIIESEKGTYLLKRRPKNQDDQIIVPFSHSVQMHLQIKGFPVAKLISCGKGKNEETALYLNNSTYEMFEYTEGVRCDGQVLQVIEAGRKLGQFHEKIADFEGSWIPQKKTYHDSGSVRGHLRMIRKNKSNPQLQLVADRLMMHYNQSSVAVNSLGFDSWPSQIVHADWHPGNLLYEGKAIKCVLDFDSIRIAPVITDLANGMLQFSIVGVRPNPVDWPAYLDQSKMAYFIEGYSEVIRLPEIMLQSILDLMIEIMIAEAVLPIAATGYFGHHEGLDFLNMIHRKCDWIDENRETLKEVIFH